MARSMSLGSRTLTGLNSDSKRRRHRLDRAQLADASRYGRIPNDGHSRHAGRDLLEQFQPFRTNTKFGSREPNSVAARPRQAIDKAGADRIGSLHEHDGHGAARLLQGPHDGTAGGDDHVRRERDQLRSVFADVFGIASAPTGVNPHVAAVYPPQLLQALPEGGDAGQPFNIVRSQTREHADAPHGARPAAHAPSAATQP